MDELYAICRTFEIDDNDARGFTLKKAGGENGEGTPWSIMISRKGSNYYAFENACPHQGKTIDGGGGELMDDEGNFLVCRHHGAQFDLDTGHCFSGPCQGKALTPIKVVVDDGDVCITGVELAEEDGLDLADSDVPEVVITGD
ncbi:Rieske (2Fe-2S) protein [Rhodoblastus sp.]|jgi:nitrite reductase/ring-hydroxylating ferredoxin subunit|uniref:Rieske (2Fe-2S) protein n=1 Tax=Rhodoblastus sp. TaxID=1962975 RepID=UPI00260134CA|nr:Rieske (2Fe-2S) protein [Rhodoblastus sp.]